MKIVVLSALGNTTARHCINSLLETIPVSNFDMHLVRERGFREQTLNFSLSLVGTDDDILFVGDDIEFTPGWYEALMANYDQADIIGFSMLYPGTDKVQDRGYDLVQIDNRIGLEARDRGLMKAEVAPFGSRTCDGVCGCFMLVKRSVFDLVPQFSEEGRNRWGEFIFMTQARQHRARIAVIDHYLYHGGESTKFNPNKALSSISYMVERDIWKDIIDRYVDRSAIQLHYHRQLSPDLQHRLEEGTGRLLIYGIGTVTEFILGQVHLDKSRVAFCSGLPEEAGMDYCGQKVSAITDVPFEEFSWVLITPLYIGEKLFREVLAPVMPEGYTYPVFAIEETKVGTQIIYGMRQIA